MGAVEELGEWDEAHAKQICVARGVVDLAGVETLISTEGEVKSWVQWEKGPKNAPIASSTGMVLARPKMME